MTPSRRGPFAYENWRAFLAGKPAQIKFEFPLFTDVRITGHITEGFGPYQLLNTIPLHEPDTLVPSIILRTAWHREVNIDDSQINKTDTSRYHGGAEEDEIAAFLSLCMGIRLKAGGCTREFYPDQDPVGRPTAAWVHTNPVLLKSPSFDSKLPILPRATGRHNINSEAVILARLPELEPPAAMALTRAARQYQDAVWIAESEPEIAWLLLVSAVEAAAGHWRGEEDTSIEKMRTSAYGPELEKLLSKAGGNSLVCEVAALIAPYSGATKTFVNFILQFRPLDPPKERPSEKWAQYPWDENNLKKSVSTIYHLRSRALHDGTPFPWPMCQPPRLAEFQELPLANRARGGEWLESDAPMLLHLFEYVVRHSLLNWWRSMLDEKRETH